MAKHAPTEAYGQASFLVLGALTRVGLEHPHPLAHPTWPVRASRNCAGHPPSLTPRHGRKHDPSSTARDLTTGHTQVPYPSGPLRLAGHSDAQLRAWTPHFAQGQA